MESASSTLLQDVSSTSNLLKMTAANKAKSLISIWHQLTQPKAAFYQHISMSLWTNLELAKLISNIWHSLFVTFTTTGLDLSRYPAPASMHIKSRNSTRGLDSPRLTNNVKTNLRLKTRENRMLVNNARWMSRPSMRSFTSCERAFLLASFLLKLLAGRPIRCANRNRKLKIANNTS